jgi:hypothetical protein
MAEEKRFENKVKRWLESQGIYPLGTAPDKMPLPPVGYYVKRWGGGQYQKAGLPDMQIVVKGTCLEVELKAENGVISELQKQKLAQIKQSGGHAYVVRPSSFEHLTIPISILLEEGEKCIHTVG